jgi:hypothetical protein
MSHIFNCSCNYNFWVKTLNTLKNIRHLLVASREADVEINSEKIFFPHLQNAGKNCNVKRANKCLKNMGKFKYWEE